MLCLIVVALKMRVCHCHRALARLLEHQRELQQQNAVLWTLHSHDDATKERLRALVPRLLLQTTRVSPTASAAALAALAAARWCVAVAARKRNVALRNACAHHRPPPVPSARKLAEAFINVFNEESNLKMEASKVKINENVRK